jgi:ribosomal protein L28
MFKVRVTIEQTRLIEFPRDMFKDYSVLQSMYGILENNVSTYFEDNDNKITELYSDTVKSLDDDVEMDECKMDDITKFIVLEHISKFVKDMGFEINDKISNAMAIKLQTDLDEDEYRINLDLKGYSNVTFEILQEFIKIYVLAKESLEFIKDEHKDKFEKRYEELKVENLRRKQMIADENNLDDLSKVVEVYHKHPEKESYKIRGEKFLVMPDKNKVSFTVLRGIIHTTHHGDKWEHPLFTYYKSIGETFVQVLNFSNSLGSSNVYAHFTSFVLYAHAKYPEWSKKVFKIGVDLDKMSKDEQEAHNRIIISAKCLSLDHRVEINKFSDEEKALHKKILGMNKES